MSVFLTNVDLFFVKCDPQRPSRKMNPENPQWEVQIRTLDSDVAEKWKAMGLTVKFQIPAGMKPADGFYRANITKRAFKVDGSPGQPVEVVTGDLKPLNPNTIGNGSKGNLRLLKREYTHNGQQKVGYYLMGIQVTYLKPYEGGANGFDAANYTVDNSESQEEMEDVPNEFTRKPVQFAPPTNVSSNKSPTDF